MEFDKFMIIKQRFGTQIKMNLKNKNDINTYLEKNMTGLDVKYINPIINNKKIEGIFNNKIEHKNSTKIGYENKAKKISAMEVNTKTIKPKKSMTTEDRYMTDLYDFRVNFIKENKNDLPLRSANEEDVWEKGIAIEMSRH